jgi:hypothetical protein
MQRGRPPRPARKRETVGPIGTVEGRAAARTLGLVNVVGRDDEGGSQMSVETVTPRTEEFRITGEELVAKVKGLVHEGNIRRLIIRNDEGTTLIEIPLTIGLVGAALLPVWAAVGAIAALATDYSIIVERRD